MITKTQSDLRREVYGETKMIFSDETVLEKAVVAFEISKIKYEILAEQGQRQLAAMKVLYPDQFLRQDLTDEEVVVHVYESLMRKCMNDFHEATVHLEKKVALLSGDGQKDDEDDDIF